MNANVNNLLQEPDSLHHPFLHQLAAQQAAQQESWEGAVSTNLIMAVLKSPSHSLTLVLMTLLPRVSGCLQLPTCSQSTLTHAYGLLHAPLMASSNHLDSLPFGEMVPLALQWTVIDRSLYDSPLYPKASEAGNEDGVREWPGIAFTITGPTALSSLGNSCLLP